MLNVICENNMYKVMFRCADYYFIVSVNFFVISV